MAIKAAVGPYRPTCRVLPDRDGSRRRLRMSLLCHPRTSWKRTDTNDRPMFLYLQTGMGEKRRHRNQFRAGGFAQRAFLPAPGRRP